MALRWRPSDPGRYALRLAVRTGIVLPISFALGRATGDEQSALFAAFGTMAVVVFVDFGGPRRTRLRAYAALALAGSAFIALGTVCADEPVLAAAVMFLVGFAVLFSGVVNGYLAAGSIGALLTYVLPAMIPGGAEDIPMRLVGWWIAVVTGVVAIFAVFPARPHDRLRVSVAAACRALAAYVRDGGEDRRARLDDAVSQMRTRFGQTPYRPSGPTGATGAVARMVDELDWLRILAARRAARPLTLRPTPGELALRAHSADALDASAALVERSSTAVPDVDALEQGRARAFEELVGQIGDPAIRDDRTLLDAALRRAWDARAVSFMVLEVAGRAMIAGGVERGGGGALAASARVALAHAGVRSVWFRNSVRGALGLAIAVLLAGELSVQHAFWVVLATLSVLRSSALSTGATIVRALGGTVLGLAAGSALVLAIGHSDTALWIALPFVAMLAAYAPRAVSFAAGQAGFSVLVLILFDLLAPGDPKVGLVRLEDVALGCAISLGMGLLLWPRGAADVLRRALDDALTASGASLAAAAHHLGLGTRPDAVREAATAASAAAGRLDIALRQRLAERAGHPLQVTSLAGLAGAASRLRFAADGLEYLATRIGDAPRPAGAEAIAAEGGDIADWYARLGAGVAAHTPPPDSARVPRELADTLVAAARDGYARGSRERLVASTAIVWGCMHLEVLHALEERCARAAATLERPAG